MRTGDGWILGSSGCACVLVERANHVLVRYYATTLDLTRPYSNIHPRHTRINLDY